MVYILSINSTDSRNLLHVYIKKKNVKVYIICKTKYHVSAYEL
jgi:hypothetical protein